MRSNVLFLIVSIAMLSLVVLFPIVMVGINIPESIDSGVVSTTNHLSIITRTLGWSITVAVLSVCIGWPLGIRLATVSTNVRFGIIAALLMTLAIPSYAVFYAWWQTWPIGTALHGYLVNHSLLGTATQICALAAFVGWSWPIPALIAAMASKSDSTQSVLHRLDGLHWRASVVQHILVDKRLIGISILLVMSITAANTTCFDLAQISTVGNELRAIIAAGGTAFDVPWLSFAGLAIATLATFALLRFSAKKSKVTQVRVRSWIPIAIVWLLLSGGPLMYSAFISVQEGGLQLWEHYRTDMLVSIGIATAVSICCVVIMIASSVMHLSVLRRIRILASVLDCIWILVAFLPASIVSSVLANAWHQGGMDVVYKTQAILVIAHVSRVGFLGALAGRWVASCANSKTLCKVDGVQTIGVILLAIRHRLALAAMVVVGVSLSMSLGEVALTAQLAPPSEHQPIAVALLNAMHYQRPQIVTSALFVIVAVAGLGGLLISLTSRKFIATILCALVFISCDAQEQKPISNAIEIGGPGLVDGRFMTPRAIDASDDVLVVIDKSGRLQRFSLSGEFLSSWELQLSGTGYPTGVSIDDEGNIWIPDTHQHRVLVLDQRGNEILQFGSYGTDDGQFLYPTDIAFGNNSEIYVAEYGGNDRISVFDTQGTFLRAIGHHGADPEGFKRPQSIAIEPSSGHLYIADSGNHRIVVRKTSGELVRIISSAGRGQGQLLYPYGITIDSHDTLLVCEFGNNRLQRFSLVGDPLGIYGGAGDQLGLFKTPWSVVSTQQGVIIVDTGNNRLQLLPDMMFNR